MDSPVVGIQREEAATVAGAGIEPAVGIAPPLQAASVSAAIEAAAANGFMPPVATALQRKRLP